MRVLITEVAAADAPAGTDEQRIGELYASFLDEQTIARMGVQPLLDELATIDAAADRTDLAAVLGGLQRTGVGGGAGVYVNTDSKDSTRYLLYLNQSGLGLPDESYYREEQHAEILAAYPRHIATMFALVYGGAPTIIVRRPSADRRAGDQAGRRALGRGQAPRRRADLQLARVRRSVCGSSRFRLGRLGERARQPPQAVAEFVVRQPDYLTAFAATVAQRGSRRLEEVG